VSLVALNVLRWPGHILFFKPSLLLADLSVSLLVALLTAGLGVLFSLRSSTVQQAQQATMSVLLLPGIVLQFGLMLVLESPAAKAALQSALGALKFGQLMLVIVSVLAVAAVGLLLAATARFQRSRLILG